MIAIKDMEMLKYCSYWDIETRKWIECPIYKSCKHHTSDIDVKPFDCPLVEIITCKDCKHYENILAGVYKDGSKKILHVCKEHERSVSEDFYCADAERRE